MVEKEVNIIETLYYRYLYISNYSKTAFWAVLWIRDIRIRIRGSVLLTYGSGSGTCFFLQ
jgi:hypothetical protein